MVPEGHTISLTYDADGTIAHIEVRNSAGGDYLSDAVLDEDKQHFSLGEDLATSPPLPDWLGPFLDSLGAPKQQTAISEIIGD